MLDRLSPLDSSFLYLEESVTAMHVGSVLIFETPEQGFDYEELLALVANRIAYVHRYRQRVRQVPAGLGGPVWVDDADFDLTYHVRRSALPRPGTVEQLGEFVARVQSRLLDRSRPLWEVYLVEGLEGNRFALVTKTHQAMVDGVTGIDIGQVILDDAPNDVVPIAQTWSPKEEPSDLELLARAGLGTATSPRRLLSGLRGGLEDLRHTGARVVEAAGQAATALVRTAASPAPSTPLNTTIGNARRVELVELDLKDFRTVRSRRFGATADHGHVTVNDVVLATLTGALREWLMNRGEPVSASTTLRAMVPLSVTDTAVDSHVGGPVVAAFIDLPVGEPSTGMRLRQVSYRMSQQLQHGQAVGAAGLAGLAGFAPSTLHSMAARLASAMSRRMFNLVISNVPGPQASRYAGHARMVASYPVIPLARGQALAVGLTSYDGRVFLGLNGDRDAMVDLDVLAEAVHSALAELVEYA
ncbi:WS/DGAT/MGAT family O-acyltransferase [Ornithinicoccus hortensis]|uniref:Diacylglycerol O-acyltransferase n=1 Tax=Ornithinicoccus hortensis TaxID=82346 RepID=A0A542YQH3_9MICO|nr:wax ester/triacylglycerol synthase family O-acyltransferase [Ornithinicoccus hortensis]TQL50352.1 WS/DGAT/MGAT family acyltransferase [Ornithinicoccus hortensis]